MLRLLLLLLLAFIVWKVVQVAYKIFSSSQRNSGAVKPGPQEPQSKQTFTDVRDAKFEDLPPPPSEKDSDKR